MSNRKKFYLFMFPTFITATLLFIISCIIMDKLNIWIPMLVTGILFIIVFVVIMVIYIKKVKFICPNCKQMFKPTNNAIIWAMHTPTKRRLKCPHCNTKSWCKEDFE